MENTHSKPNISAHFICIAVIIAGLSGGVLGLLMGRIVPAGKFSWASLAFLPLWFLVEFVFEVFISTFGKSSRLTKILVTMSLLLSFYIAWFIAHPS